MKMSKDIESNGLVVNGKRYSVKLGYGRCSEDEQAVMLQLLHGDDVALTGYVWGADGIETWTDIDDDALVESAFELLEQLRPKAA